MPCSACGGSGSSSGSQRKVRMPSFKPLAKRKTVHKYTPQQIAYLKAYYAQQRQRIASHRRRYSLF